MEPIISFKNYNFKYRSLSEPTLKNINLDFYPGERILIAGPSGSGKSTLAHCLNGLIPFSYDGEITGELTVKGIQPNKVGIFETSKVVGTILQDQDAQFIGLSVGEDVAFVAENEMIPQEEMHQQVLQALKRVDLVHMIEKSPHELSGGQKQRVSLAGILATEADILLFDEPLANLDPANVSVAMELISEIHQKTGKTIIIIEHRIEDVLEQDFDRIVVIAGGEIVGCGTPDEILASAVLRSSGLREPLYVEALKDAGCELTSDDQISKLTNLRKPKFKNALKDWYQRRNYHDVAKNLQRNLSLKNVRFSYDGSNEVISGVSFDIFTGEIVAILGNNGAGKSTISNLITGICKPQQGKIYYREEDITNWAIRKRGQKIGYVMQNPNLMITQYMIKDEVALGLRAKGLTENLITEKVEQVLKICGLYPYRNWPVTALSYGQKKRLSIASILVLEPEILILDEPTAGQDYRHYTEFMEFIRILASQGIGIILITHDMYLALEYAQRAVVISNGQKIADAKVESVLTDQDVIKEANLKETSLSKLARLCQIDQPEDFVRHFIDYERQVKEHE